jgi:hypothetical protein
MYMFTSRARYNRFEFYSLLFCQNRKIYKTVVFVVQNEDKSMHAVSTFNIDSVVVYRSLYFGIWSPLRTVSLSLFRGGVLFLYVGTLFLRVDGHYSGLYPFLFFSFLFFFFKFVTAISQSKLIYVHLCCV